jgi:uncharacterized phiE125 gp8 family phage protein
MRGVIDCVDTLLVGPTVEPLDLAEVKKALKFTPTSEDTLLDVWIAAARQHFEEQTGRQVMTARRSRRLACAPSQREIELPFPPLQEVIGVTTDDENGDPVTFDAAEYDVVLANNGPTCPRGRIRLKPGAAWPTGGPITIEYLCGYGDAPGAVPELVRGALHLLVGHFHKFRSEVQEVDPGKSLAQLPFGASAILSAFKWSALEQVVPRYAGGATAWV